MKFRQIIFSLLTLFIFSSFCSYATDRFEVDKPQDNSPSFSSQTIRDEVKGVETLFTPSEEQLSEFLWKENLVLDHTTKQSYGDEDLEPKFGLSIDGGGMRGLMPAIQLQILKEKLKEEGFNKTPFNYIGGTSIGGIVGLGVAAELEPDNLVELFTNHGQKIFPPTSWKVKFKTLGGLIGCQYQPDPLESLLQDQFGNVKMEELATPTLVTACTTRGKPILFKSSSENDKSHKVWEVARATSAAPTYFPAYTLTTGDPKTHYVDGGIWVNNPSVHLLTSMVQELHDGKFSPSNLYMLSLGTGDMSLQTILANNAGLSSAGDIINLLMSSNSQGNHQMMRSLLGDNYFRINPLFTGKSIDLSDTGEDTINTLKACAEHESSCDILKNFVKKFMKNKRQK